MKAYPKYKNSGIEWLGEIPVGWEVYKLKHACNHVGSGTTPDSTSNEYYEGDILWVTTGELRESYIVDTTKKVNQKALANFSALRFHPKGSILIAMYGATIGRLGILGKEAVCNQACLALSCNNILFNKYLFYLLLSMRDDLIKLASGGGQPNVNQEKLSSLRLSAPPLPEQKAIATFLDRETGTIDNLIAKQEQMIVLLEEKRQALISHAVNDKSTKLVRLGRVAYQNNRFFTPESEVPYKPLGMYNKARGFFQKEETVGKDLGESDFHWIKNNDFVISGQFAWEGAVGLAGKTENNCIASHRYYSLSGNKQILDNAYLYAFFTSPFGDFLLDQHSIGSAGRNRPLNINTLLKEEISIPSIELQLEVSKLVHYEKIIKEKIKVPIDLLKEKRSSLISAAVTGKIDVRAK